MENNKRNSKNCVIDHLLIQVPTAVKEDKVSKVLEMIRRKKGWDTINYIYILNGAEELVGVVSIKELLRAKDSTLMKEIMTRRPTGVSASAKQERAVVEAIHYNIKAVPILKAGTREFLGVVGTDKILNILHHEHVEDLLRFSGISKKHPTVDTSKFHPFKLVRLRLPWLLLGLVGGMIAAFLVSQFEPILQKELALVFFMPVVVYIGNAVSTQTQALLIRLLSSRRVRAKTFLKKELLVSLFLSLIAAIVISTFAGVWLQSVKITLIIGLAIIASTLAAVTIGITIPSVLYAAKKDPALGSGPFATAIQDISTLLIYFLIASLVLL